MKEKFYIKIDEKQNTISAVRHQKSGSIVYCETRITFRTRGEYVINEVKREYIEKIEVSTNQGEVDSFKEITETEWATLFYKAIWLIS